MKKELDEELCKKYPKIFRDRHANRQTTCMCWGLECGDGWYWLIDNLCKMLMWDPTTGKQNENPPVATQVKEKFGALRFYVDHATERQYNYIEMAEFLSGSICEICGTTKEVFQTKGWRKTICKSCDEIRESTRE